VAGRKRKLIGRQERGPAVGGDRAGPLTSGQPFEGKEEDRP
jgi:hypothetical protein